MSLIRERTRPTAVHNPSTAPARSKAIDPTLTDQIRKRAFEIYLARRGGPGDALSDWLRAEREIRATAPVVAESRSTRSQARGVVLMRDDD
jgi:hypothetical protein